MVLYRMDNNLKYIDLFAGIGGFRLAFDKAGFECVGTSEINPFAQKTYLANFKNSHMHGDIKTYKPPQHDLLLGGFPCQPFSIAGVSSKNFWGHKHGFDCEKQGNMFFEVAKIIKDYQPKAFVLENVKNLLAHDKGNTFEVIKSVLIDLGYDIKFQVLNASNWVPQKRERIFIVGFKDKNNFEFENVLNKRDKKITMSKILHDFRNEPVDPKLFLSDKLWKYLQYHSQKHAAKGNGFGYGLVDGNSVARTLSARYYKDGSEILVQLNGYKIPRRLSPRECARIMGYPESFKIVVSNTQAYKQFGNSVVTSLVADVAKEVKRVW